MNAASDDFSYAPSTSPATDAPDLAQPPAAARKLSFSFTGTGEEYFRIWIVNLLLTVATLGIYGSWAKVRTLHYFYRNTRLDGAGFDYHGKPSSILKGRVIVVLMLLAYQAASYVSPILSALMFLAFLAVLPLLLVRSLRFRMANSSYRGLRFGFVGGDIEGYKVFALWPLAAVLTLGLLGPLSHHRLKRYQHNHARFGTAPFAFTASAGAFYGVYLPIVVLVAFIAVVLTTGAMAGLGKELPIGVAIASLYLGLLIVGPYLTARLQNLVWSHTTLAPHEFRSDVSGGRMAFISITNLLAIVATLGLYLPFAQVRAARYRLECVTMLAAGPLDSFVGGEAQSVGALGDATVDWADIDIAL